MDMGPLRQTTSDKMNQAAILYQPTDAIRGVYDAVFQYYLKSKADSVVFEILDADGKLVRKFVGNKPDEKPATGDWWGRGESKTHYCLRIKFFQLEFEIPGCNDF
ncbi:MAG: hypothetical protein U5K54_08995 [Cytophagales bacterium]|nr:hypothetical protein [Cytophagales bacterium]